MTSLMPFYIYFFVSLLPSHSKWEEMLELKTILCFEIGKTNSSSGFKEEGR